jgi:lysophospholipase L1-like esterase
MMMRLIPSLLIVALGCLRPCAAAEEPADDFSRWEKAISAFDEMDAREPPPKGGVVFVGSSSMRLWDLKESFPELRAINRGFGGSQLADAVHFAERIVLKHRPRMVVVYSGDNDLNAGKTPGRVADDFKALVRKVHSELPRARIVFIAIKPSLKRWSIVEQVRAANERIRAICEEDERLAFVDVFTPMLGPDGTPRPELFVDDGLHLSEAGYALWTELVGPHLNGNARR